MRFLRKKHIVEVLLYFIITGLVLLNTGYTTPNKSCKVSLKKAMKCCAVKNNLKRCNSETPHKSDKCSKCDFKKPAKPREEENPSININGFSKISSSTFIRSENIKENSFNTDTKLPELYKIYINYRDTYLTNSNLRI